MIKPVDLVKIAKQQGVTVYLAGYTCPYEDFERRDRIQSLLMSPITPVNSILTKSKVDEPCIIIRRRKKHSAGKT